MKFTHNKQEYELILLHLAGSKLYGNSTPESDTDIRGVFIAPKETKLGLIGSVEQIQGQSVIDSLRKAGLDIEDTDDIVLYELSRFASLASDSNPNIMDTLCCPIDKTLYVNSKGEELINNRHLFISSRLKFTFSGYAISQLNKIKNRDKYINKYPEVHRVLDYIKLQYDNKNIDFNWICNNFGGSVAEFVTDESPQNNIKLNNVMQWDNFKDNSLIKKIDEYRRPRLIDYSTAKDLKGKSISLSAETDIETGEFKKSWNYLSLRNFLYQKASFRTFSPSMLAIYTGGNGIFTNEGKLKANDPEFIGEFVCLLSIDQNNFKAESDFIQAMWEWKCKRNEARSELEAKYGVDLKNVSHLWRLMTKAKEILLTGDYNPVLEGQELQDLISIRNGSKWGEQSYEKSIEFAERNDLELNELYKTSKLQKKADMIGINNLILKLQDI